MGEVSCLCSWFRGFIQSSPILLSLGLWQAETFGGGQGVAEAPHCMVGKRESVMNRLGILHIL